ALAGSSVAYDSARDLEIHCAASLAARLEPVPLHAACDEPVELQIHAAVCRVSGSGSRSCASLEIESGAIRVDVVLVESCSGVESERVFRRSPDSGAIHLCSFDRVFTPRCDGADEAAAVELVI